MIKPRMPVREQGGRRRMRTGRPRTRTAGALPGRSWSKYAQLVARVGLDLAGTAIALLALGGGTGRGSDLADHCALAAVVGVGSVSVGVAAPS